MARCGRRSRARRPTWAIESTPPSSLSAEGYRDLNAALARQGFHGATRIDLRPGTTRFRYNQLGLYAASPEMAACGERILHEHYGSQRVHIGRGVDAPPPPGEEATDWHHYLLAGHYPRLPESIRRYVEFTGPLSAEPCPSAQEVPPR